MIAQVGVQASPISKSLVVAGISLEILSGSSSNYLGRWIVTFDSSIAVRAIRPLSISTTLTVDASAPAAAKITGCMEGLGIAQKWANVPILNGVTYQNTDFKPIQVKVTATGFSTWAYLSIAASDDNITWVTLDRNTCYDTGVVTATIPSQHYYRAWMHGNMAGPRAIILTSVLK